MIYTSYFANIDKLPAMTFFSIAGKSPDWFINSKNINYCQYKELAPKWFWWKEWHFKFKNDLESEESKKWYIDKYYQTILNNLNPYYIYNDICKKSNFNDACLLCYESPNKFCHRHIVSEWLNKNNIKCKELI